MSTYSAGTFVGSIGGVARALDSAADGLLGLLGSADESWLRSLQQASFGAVNFGVDGGSISAGRKTVVHEYAFRDEVWVEDLGKKARRFSIAGFLLENDLIYGGGPVIQQREALLRVVEAQLGGVQPGQTLVHPTLGKIDNVCCINFECQESKTIGSCFEIRFDFIVSGARKYPATSTSAADLIGDAANDVKEASILDYVAQVASDIKKGAAVVKQAIRTAVGWYTKAIRLVNDVRRIFRSISTLGGNFGTLFGGANAGYSAKNTPAPRGTTAAQLLAADTAKRAAVASAGDALAAAANTPADGVGMGAAATALTQALAATASDPADGVRLLSDLAQYQPADPTTSSQTGLAMASMQAAMGALLRRTALAELATTVQSYQPASSDEAIAVRNQVAGLIAAEIQVAGDSGDDESYVALIGLRAAVIKDMNERGAKLAAMSDFSFNGSLNAYSLAQRLYRDPGRATELIRQAQPVHPAFMPHDFRALSE